MQKAREEGPHLGGDKHNVAHSGGRGGVLWFDAHGRFASGHIAVLDLVQDLGDHLL